MATNSVEGNSPDSDTRAQSVFDTLTGLLDRSISGAPLSTHELAQLATRFNKQVTKLAPGLSASSLGLSFPGITYPFIETLLANADVVFHTFVPEAP